MMHEDFFAGYAIAKSGVEGITRTLARTFGSDNVRVNTALPGWVATERQLSKWWSPEGDLWALRSVEPWLATLVAGVGVWRLVFRLV